MVPALFAAVAKWNALRPRQLAPRISKKVPGQRAGVIKGVLGPTDNQDGHSMFFFFSNRFGCLGSLLISAAVTIALLFMFGMLRF
jgi:hypothetical protein